MFATRVLISALLLWTLAACGSATADPDPAPTPEPDATADAEVATDDVYVPLEDAADAPEEDTSETAVEVLEPEEVLPTPSYCGDGVAHRNKSSDTQGSVWQKIGMDASMRSA